MAVEEVKVRRRSTGEVGLTIGELASFLTECHESIAEGFEAGEIYVENRMRSGFSSIEVTLSRRTGAR